MKIEIKEKKDAGRLTYFILSAAIFVSAAGGFLSAAELSIWTKFSSGGILNGLKLICNQIFETSEKYQAYKYIRFTANQQENYISALLLMLLIIAVFVMITLKFKNIIMYASLFLIFTGFQIYFGIFAAPVWNVAFYAFFAVAVMRGNIYNIALFLIILSAVCSLVYLTYQGANPTLSDLSEMIRDRFDEKTENQQNYETQRNNDSISEQNQEKQVKENPSNYGKNNTDSDKYKIESEKILSGSQIGAFISQNLLLILIIISIVILIFLLRLLLLFTKAAKHRKQFDSPDCAAAVNLMFNYLMQFLSDFGLEPINIKGTEKNIFLFYASQLEYIVSRQYSEEYLNIAEMWLETVYSDHEITLENRKKMRTFLDKTPMLLSKNQKLFGRMKIKLYRLYK